MADKTTIQITKQTRDKLNNIIDKFGGLNQNSIIEYIVNTIIMNENLFIIDFKNRQFVIKKDE